MRKVLGQVQFCCSGLERACAPHDLAEVHRCLKLHCAIADPAGTYTCSPELGGSLVETADLGERDGAVIADVESALGLARAPVCPEGAVIETERRGEGPMAGE